jgi:hypothetical protein
MKRAYAVAALFACFTLGILAAPSSRVKESVDPQSKLRSLLFEARTYNCAAPTSNDPNDSAVRLEFAAVENTQGSGVDYVLSVDMTGGNFIHPGRQGALETLADGTHDELHPVDKISKWSDHNTWSGRREKRELIPFGADRAFLESIAKAKTFQFTVHGADGDLERCTDGKELHHLQELLDRAAVL